MDHVISDCSSGLTHCVHSRVTVGCTVSESIQAMTGASRYNDTVADHMTELVVPQGVIYSSPDTDGEGNFHTQIISP